MNSCDVNGPFTGGVYPICGGPQCNPSPSDIRTLRDEFAMAALTGALANSAIFNKFGGAEPRELAVEAYSFADAMMTASMNAAIRASKKGGSR